MPWGNGRKQHPFLLMPKVEEVASLMFRSLYTQSWSECRGKQKIPELQRLQTCTIVTPPNVLPYLLIISSINLN
jgi:hypothetical protein